MRTSPSHLRTRCRGFQCTENRNIANLWQLRFLKRLVLPSSLVIERRRVSSRGDRHRDPDRRYNLAGCPAAGFHANADQSHHGECLWTRGIASETKIGKIGTIGENRRATNGAASENHRRACRSAPCAVTSRVRPWCTFSPARHLRKIQLCRAAELIRKHTRFSTTRAEHTRFD